tara:strand:- start:70 stop:420 length:351 start_codon:yes stop_codon:yes gene_type:complete
MILSDILVGVFVSVALTSLSSFLLWVNYRILKISERILWVSEQLLEETIIIREETIKIRVISIDVLKETVKMREAIGEPLEEAEKRSTFTKPMDDLEKATRRRTGQATPPRVQLTP